MTIVEDRFECFPDPLDNWMVWDIAGDDVAQIGMSSWSIFQRLRHVQPATC
jgi:hypothetical protein